MPRIEFADEALADLRSIIAYSVDHWGAAQARKYVAGLRSFCAELAAVPAIGKEAGWLMPGLRSFPYQSHVIYYREHQDGIFVVAIIPSSPLTKSRRECRAKFSESMRCET